MSAATLLLKLRRLDVVLQADGERLQFDAIAAVAVEAEDATDYTVDVLPDEL